jgi:hypothetical protein
VDATGGESCHFRIFAARNVEKLKLMCLAVTFSDPHSALLMLGESSSGKALAGR